jgi:hypothetical protein
MSIFSTFQTLFYLVYLTNLQLSRMVISSSPDNVSFSKRYFASWCIFSKFSFKISIALLWHDLIINKTSLSIL